KKWNANATRQRKRLRRVTRRCAKKLRAGMQRRQPNPRKVVNNTKAKKERRQWRKAKGVWPERDRNYCAFIRVQPCLYCGNKEPSECAHIGPHGISQKASDYMTAPMCRGCHADLHARPAIWRERVDNFLREGHKTLWMRYVMLCKAIGRAVPEALLKRLGGK